jgi:hypothetical protein
MEQKITTDRPYHETNPTSYFEIEREHEDMAIIWEVAPCSLIDTDRRFRGTYCLHYSPDDGGSKLF